MFARCALDTLRPLFESLTRNFFVQFLAAEQHISYFISNCATAEIFKSNFFVESCLSRDLSEILARKHNFYSIKSVFDAITSIA